MLALTLLFWPIAAVIRRHYYGKPLGLTVRQRRLRISVRMVCLLDLVFSAAFVFVFWLASNDNSLLSTRLDPWLRFIQVAGWLGVVGLPLVLYNLLLSWADHERWLWNKLGDTAITLASIVFVGFVFTWKLLALSLKY